MCTSFRILRKDLYHILFFWCNETGTKKLHSISITLILNMWYIMVSEGGLRQKTDSQIRQAGRDKVRGAERGQKTLARWLSCWIMGSTDVCTCWPWSGMPFSFSSTWLTPSPSGIGKATPPLWNCPGQHLSPKRFRFPWNPKQSQLTTF